MQRKKTSSLNLNKVAGLNLFFLLFVGILPLTGQNKAEGLPVPTLRYGEAIVCGTLSPVLKETLNINQVTFEAYNPLSINDALAPGYTYPATVAQDGKFEIAIPLFSASFIFCNFPNSQISFPMIIAPGTKTKLELREEAGAIRPFIESPFSITTQELQNAVDFISDHIINNQIDLSSTPGAVADRRKAYEEFDTGIREKIDSSDLSDAARTWAYMESQSFQLSNFLDLSVHYGDQPDYFKILQLYDLKNPNHLYSTLTWLYLMDFISNPFFQLPSIGDQPVANWISEVSGILKPYLGFEEGWLYDLLAVASYYQQMVSRVPLTTVQQSQIRTYYHENGLDRFLVTVHEKLVGELAEEANKIINLCDVPDAPAEELMEKIISNYRGKTVLVDLWATWCGPCIAGIKAFEPKKSQFRGTDVAFVYITNTSSPYEEFQDWMKVMEGEHYYLERELFAHFYSQFDLQGIPAYLVFDKDGNLIRKQVGFSTAALEEIEQLLLQSAAKE